jgi:hypothetical protein
LRHFGLCTFAFFGKRKRAESLTVGRAWWKLAGVPVQMRNVTVYVAGAHWKNKFGHNKSVG